jgi:hypothetical protein
MRWQISFNFGKFLHKKMVAWTKPALFDHWVLITTDTILKGISCFGCSDLANVELQP